MAEPRAPEAGPVGVVLAGGGARGAYELGALSVIAPALEARGERVEVVVGTSVGALNVAWLAANLHRPLAELLVEGDRLWRSVRWDDVVEPLLSPGVVSRAVRYLLRVGGVPLPRVAGLLDPAPLAGTLRRIVDPAAAARNVESGVLHAAAVATTANTTARTVVFHHGGGRPANDRRRGIDYVPTRLSLDHVRASAAIPVAFPAVEVREPRAARGWYFDGGTRLNTPIKPALRLGAQRVVVVGLNSTASPVAPGAERERPDVFEGASHIAQALLADQLAHDVHHLARRNDDGTSARIPYIFVAPPDRRTIGRIALDVHERCYAGVAGAKRSPNVALLGRLVHAGAGPIHGELLSYLFFAPEFHAALIERGRADAEWWLRRRHWDGPWRLGPPPERRS